MQSLLSLPIITSDGTLIGVIESFRKNSIFTGLDERIGAKILKSMSRASIESY